MTNAQKYYEVFGIIPDKDMCPTKDCKDCPIYNSESIVCLEPTDSWWDSEYKEKTDENS